MSREMVLISKLKYDNFMNKLYQLENNEENVNSLMEGGAMLNSSNQEKDKAPKNSETVNNSDAIGSSNEVLEKTNTSPINLQKGVSMMFDDFKKRDGKPRINNRGGVHRKWLTFKM